MRKRMQKDFAGIFQLFLPLKVPCFITDNLKISEKILYVHRRIQSKFLFKPVSE